MNAKIFQRLNTPEFFLGRVMKNEAFKNWTKRKVNITKFTVFKIVSCVQVIHHYILVKIGQQKKKYWIINLFFLSLIVSNFFLSYIEFQLICLLSLQNCHYLHFLTSAAPPLHLTLNVVIKYFVSHFKGILILICRLL